MLTFTDTDPSQESVAFFDNDANTADWQATHDAIRVLRRLIRYHIEAIEPLL